MNDTKDFRRVVIFYHAMLDDLRHPPYTEDMETGIQNIEFDPSKLREARERKFPEMSQRQVAINALGIDPQRLSAYELGKDNPTPTMLARMCALYKVKLVPDLTKQAA
ncbi:MAG TPA: helix-turn-helix transcriptional regulator [Blastocatellia bacterium]|nr:helix-turn-helix transcriptional regulator [Blastocatellia bacterium]